MRMLATAASLLGPNALQGAPTWRAHARASKDFLHYTSPLSTNLQENTRPEAGAAENPAESFHRIFLRDVVQLRLKKPSRVKYHTAHQKTAKTKQSKI